MYFCDYMFIWTICVYVYDSLCIFSSCTNTLGLNEQTELELNNLNNRPDFQIEFPAVN